jgi:hypothetical protein
VTVLAQLGWASQVVFTLAGPLAGCAAALFFVLLGARSHLWVLAFTACVLLASELRNFWPAERRGTTSDGAQLLEAIRAPRPAGPRDPIVEIETRWLVLISDFQRAVGGRGQNIFLGVLAALDRPLTDRSDEGRALVHLAFCGWCWREAEHGDTNPVRALVLDSRRRATLTGATGSDITALAADGLVREDVDLAAGSPIPDSLEKGLPCACNNVSCGSLPQDQVWFAFRFGVALHDVMQVAG